MPSLRRFGVPHPGSSAGGMIDQFYTPPALAAFLVGAARIRSPRRIADFAMGDGALLRAAEVRWPRAKLFGSDINPAAGESAVGLTRALSFSVHDFLADTPAPNELADLGKLCDVILLNPPFTCKGNKRYEVQIGEETLAGSKALAFVARALKYLKPGGEILAIVPASCATSQRDQALLEAMRKTFTVEQIGEINRNGFDGCSVAVIVLRLSYKKAIRRRDRPASPPKLSVLKPYRVKIMRGTMPIYRTSSAPEGLPVLHTVDLRAQTASPQRWSAEARRIVSGSAVLIPRVGRPDATKLVLMKLPAVALSDCVIAIKSDPPGHEPEILRTLRANWTSLEQLYGGSCAPYITLSQLQAYFQTFGLQSDAVADMQEQVALDGGGLLCVSSELRTGS